MFYERDFNTFLGADDRDDVDDDDNDETNLISSNKTASAQSQDIVGSVNEAGSYGSTVNINTFEYESSSIFSDNVPSTSAVHCSPTQHYVQQSQEEVGEESEIIVPPIGDIDNPEHGDVGGQQHLVGQQARVLLHYFIQQQARDTPVEPIIHRLCHVDQFTLIQCGLTDRSVSRILFELRRIAAEISENQTIERFVESVPVYASKELFFEVCHRVFEDGIVNWGRIVMILYFGCRLIIRSLSQTTQTTQDTTWVKDMLRWVVDFIIKQYAKWILSRGGWGMIKEWAKFSDSVWSLLFAGSLVFAIWAYFFKK